MFEVIDQASNQTNAQWQTAIDADFAAFQNDRMIAAAGYALVQSCVSKFFFRRSIGFLGILKAALTRMGRSIGVPEDGALVPFSQNGVGQAVTTVYHDEAMNPGLDSNRFMTVTSYNGLDGYFITRPLIMSSDTSDFTELQYGRVMDEACRVTNSFFTKKLNSDVRLDPKKGTILEKDARSLESGNDSELQRVLVNTGNVSPTPQMTFVSRDDNISSTKTVTVTIKILPKGYLEQIPVTMTFINPALG